MSAVVKIGAHLSGVVIDPGPGTKYEVGAGEQQTAPSLITQHYKYLTSHQCLYTSHVQRRRVKARTFNKIFAEK